MASLVDSFLDDLEELEREEEESERAENNRTQISELCESDDDAPIIDAVEEYFSSVSNPHFVFSKKVNDPKLNGLLEKVRQLALEKDWSHSELTLIEECNQAVQEIDNEIINIYNYVRDIYSKRFPKLESIVYSPLDYIAVVRRAQNEMDFTKVTLSDILPNTMVMAITVAATTSSGSYLSSHVLKEVLAACNEGMILADFRNDILVYLETRMALLAPNVSAIIGTALAARLITQAGGLTTLAKMPSQNIMLVGGNRKGTVVPGVIYSCDIIQNAPSAVKHRAVKLVSGKLSLAAKIDMFKEATDGSMGAEYRNMIEQALQKAQEPPPAPLKKSLPVPEERKSTKRGGKRLRKAKERLAVSEFRKYANRLKFGEEAEEEYGLESGDGFGMLGKHTGYGKLRLQHKQQKLQLPKKRQIAIQSSGATNGMSSSLVFTPLQGIELCNPEAAKPAPKKKNAILDNSGGFFKVGNNAK
ncbi:pre-mRNA processing ribonucleoprotein (Prp31) C terminal domain family protein [Babesia bovis T2Bo]|uniref:pre-mRNA processing ribonucleoprotein (Prp31) C terminal domain family protein n=1 Tax=Babesia bovis T2Bo TaxID=484906 RepID=UPI001C35FE3F|nr:pre-mRNA processing ribonucleoprotein (Prp31) C terminal domain family protein [Babesia bovis T2Bo]EDO06582.2 pre-mRNA processing ribonucleoprotein (Prp31) C terminal domain family protein [Babesia bovis T2Bo]